MLLSLRSTVGWTSRVFLAYVMPWINKASLALYIARIIVTRGWPARDCSSVGQVEMEETENGNGKLKRKTEAESGNGKAENW